MKVGGSGESRDQDLRLRTGTGVPEFFVGFFQGPQPGFEGFWKDFKGFQSNFEDFQAIPKISKDFSQPASPQPIEF